jgi:fatty-acyl-CoA synthase
MDARGFLKVTGRVKDMIIRGGMNLYPAEIEAALQDHPAIETAAVIGIPDDRWGEQVGAVLRIRLGHDRPAIPALTEFLHTQLAPHKCPAYWSFTDTMPMTPSGKIQKFILRDQAAQGTLPFTQSRPTAPASS